MGSSLIKCQLQVSVWKLHILDEYGMVGVISMKDVQLHIYKVLTGPAYTLHHKWNFAKTLKLVRQSYSQQAISTLVFQKFCHQIRLSKIKHQLASILHL